MKIFVETAFTKWPASESSIFNPVNRVLLFVYPLIVKFAHVAAVTATAAELVPNLFSMNWDS
jgi:hypothetical protein